MSSGGLTLGDLVRSTRTRRTVMQRLLQEERKQGRIEFVGGKWRPTSEFVARYGWALSWLPGHNNEEGR